MLVQAGDVFCIARDGRTFAAPNERNQAHEAATAVVFGLPRGEALLAITLHPAQILGVADRLDSLAPGRLASVIVTDGDPLDTTTRVKRVFIQGREVSTASRHSPVASDRKVQAVLPPDRPPLKLAHRHSD